MKGLADLRGKTQEKLFELIQDQYYGRAEAGGGRVEKRCQGQITMLPIHPAFAGHRLLDGARRLLQGAHIDRSVAVRRELWNQPGKDERGFPSTRFAVQHQQTGAVKLTL